MRSAFSNTGPLRVGTDGPAGNRDILRAWMGYYRAQPGLADLARPSASTYSAVAQQLTIHRQHFGMSPQEHYELVVWYWVRFVPSILRSHPEQLAAPPSVRPLWGLVGYFRHWRQKAAGLVASVGIEDACQGPDEELTRWQIPEDWRR